MSLLQVSVLCADVNPFLPTVPTFAVRESDVSRHNGGTSGAPLKPLRDDSALRALSSLRALIPIPLEISVDGIFHRCNFPGRIILGGNFLGGIYRSR